MMLVWFHREVINKTNVEFQEGGKFLRYKQKKWFVFEKELSNGTEEDTFTGVNLPMLVNIICGVLRCTRLLDL